METDGHFVRVHGRLGGLIGTIKTSNTIPTNANDVVDFIICLTNDSFLNLPESAYLNNSDGIFINLTCDPTRIYFRHQIFINQTGRYERYFRNSWTEWKTVFDF